MIFDVFSLPEIYTKALKLESISLTRLPNKTWLGKAQFNDTQIEISELPLSFERTDNCNYIYFSLVKSGAGPWKLEDTIDSDLRVTEIRDGLKKNIGSLKSFLKKQTNFKPEPTEIVECPIEIFSRICGTVEVKHRHPGYYDIANANGEASSTPYEDSSARQ
eukprot:GHVP01009511.1.p1 GENE.GHVP01009511.1~~GHVP01009511.1.p1  ORF type:complete len:162 (+),score=23.41 GHVP01009511.1:1-486(+)